MPAAEKPKHLRITIKYKPEPVGKSRARIKDEKGETHFGDYKLLELKERDLLEIERIPIEPKMKDDGTYWPPSYNIKKWELIGSGTTHQPNQQELPIAPPKPIMRARTDPHDQMQMFVTALMKEWMTAYAATLMNSAATEQKMMSVNATTVLQAMEALTAAYRRYHGIRTQSGADLPPGPTGSSRPNEEEPWNDAIPEHAR